MRDANSTERLEVENSLANQCQHTKGFSVLFPSFSRELRACLHHLMIVCGSHWVSSLGQQIAEQVLKSHCSVLVGDARAPSTLLLFFF